MPLAFHRSDSRARVPIPELPFHLGSHSFDHLVVEGPGVKASHARLRMKHGSWLLSAKDGCAMWVNGERAPFMALADGDEVVLGSGPDEGAVLTFQDGLAGMFLAPGVAPIDAWLRTPAAETPEAGPARHGLGRPLSPGSRTDWLRLEGGDEALRKILRPLGPGDLQPVDYMRLFQRIAGSPHPALAALLDAGVAPIDGHATPWLLAGVVPGRSLRLEGNMPAGRATEVMAWLGDLAEGLGHLHARGVVHGDVAPGNVVLRPEGQAVLIDYGQTWPADTPPRKAKGVVGTPGFVAPEAILGGERPATTAADVYGLAACGYAWLTGEPPGGTGEVLDVLARGTRAVRPPSSRGCELSAPLEETLLAGLATDPAERPDMGMFARRLAFARAEEGL